MKAKRIISGLAITFCVLMLIWFGGWTVWTQFHLWGIMTNVEYQNSLFVLMALAMLMGGGLTFRKSKTLLERPDAHVQKPKFSAQNPVDLGPINKRVDELAEKVADMHSIISFLKNVKKKNGEKP